MQWNAAVKGSLNDETDKILITLYSYDKRLLGTETSVYLNLTFVYLQAVGYLHN